MSRGLGFPEIGWSQNMTAIVSHKGCFCIYATKFCQEGYCLGCEIYLNKESSKKTRELSDAAFLREAVDTGKH
jgi:hypothetical protein